MDLWLDGSKAATWDLRSGTSVIDDTDVITFWMRVFGTSKGEIEMDNVYVGSAVIPEPNHLALMGLLVLGGLHFFGRRRRRSANA